MRIPGPPLHIAPLSAVSPSSFTGLSQCALRAACQAARQPALLPQSPASTLGTVAHKVLEEAGQVRTSHSADDFLSRWDELVQAEEAKLQQSELQRRFVPLRQHAPRYGVQRHRACQQAARIALQVLTPAPAQGTPVGASTCTYHEEPVSTEDKAVCGIIDFAREAPDGVLLRDYKTGAIWDADEAPDGSLALKPEYQVQLKLYAALWHGKTGRWPTRLELAPLDGLPVEVPFETSECARLLEEAREALARINNSIQDVLRVSSPDLESLATPSAHACRFCSFRPGCSGYWREREQLPPEETSTWPRDVRGVLQQKQVLGNGRLLLQLLGENGHKYLVRVRPDESRYPALLSLQEQDAVAIYNLKGRPGSVLDETGTTAIYTA
jgi:RecB family exonuclease